jgi:hypothetical protein
VAGLEDHELEITKVDQDSEVLQVALHKVEVPDAKSKTKTAKADPGLRKIYRLVFSVPPGREPGIRSGTRSVKVTLHTNHKHMKTMTLHVSFNSY